MNPARARIWAGWLFAGAGVYIGIALANAHQVNAPTPVAAVLGAYMAWSITWGIPPVWRWWIGLFQNLGCFLFATPIGWLMLILLFFYIPLVGGYFYGIFGGGIYQYLKTRRLAAYLE